jgi:dTDP-4-amino-4,6-dideoxy-D-galactose acyltransferase
MCKYKILSWDSNFFGFTVAAILSDFVRETDCKILFDRLRNENVKLAYWKSKHELPTNISNATIVKADKPCTFWHKISSGDGVDPNPHISLYFQNTVSDQLNKIAIQCGAFSRFKTDSKIPYHKFEELYSLWIKNSVNKTFADNVLVYNLSDSVAGMVTVAKKEDVGYIGLFGVDSKYRGQGIGTALLAAAISYFKKQACNSVEVITQQENIPACKAYVKAGFSIKEESNYYHIWL